MRRKFALLEFVQDIDEIKFKYNIMKKSPLFIFDWYVKKFNPYSIEEIKIADTDGYIVKIPMTREQAVLAPDQLIDLLERTLIDLDNYGVEVVLPPSNIPSEFPNVIRISDHKRIFPFFIMQSIQKALHIFNKDIKTAEILIIDGDKDQTLTLVDMIYPNVNNLSIMTTNVDDFVYECLVEDIFSECGLSLRVLEKNKSALETADIIINTSSLEDRYDFYYKRGAIYFELGRNKEKLIELAGKREDMLIVDDLKAALSGNSMQLNLLETIFFVRSKQYRTLSNRGYDRHLVYQIKKELDEMKISVAHFYLADKILNSARMTKIMIKAGHGNPLP